MKDARENFQEAQKEEANEYVDDSAGVEINKNQNSIKVQEPRE